MCINGRNCVGCSANIGVCILTVFVSERKISGDKIHLKFRRILALSLDNKLFMLHH